MNGSSACSTSANWLLCCSKTKIKIMETMISDEIKRLLRSLADRYETSDFIVGDPSWFMHQVSDPADQEMIAFLASVLSYGRRDLFLPKIQRLLDLSGNHPAQWIRSGAYTADIPDDTACYYRLYNNHMMRALMDGLHDIVVHYPTIGDYVRVSAPSGNAVDALAALSGFFYARGVKGMVPAPRTSVAKRPCMFLRWMVRSSSPVDLGLWASFVDRRTLLIPMDTHVLQEARNLGLIASKTASWSTVVRLSEAMREVFPDDPARGDFALFGYGVNK